jgi:hypothetical protein
VADVLLPLSSQTLPGLSYQLLIATAHKDCMAAAVSLCHSPANSSLTPLTSWHGLCRKHHFPLLLYSLIAMELLHLCLLAEALHFYTTLPSNGSICHIAPSLMLFFLYIFQHCDSHLSKVLCLLLINGCMKLAEMFSIFF